MHSPSQSKAVLQGGKYHCFENLDYLDLDLTLRLFISYVTLEKN
jgi:hypothetical protein